MTAVVSRCSLAGFAFSQKHSPPPTFLITFFSSGVRAQTFGIYSTASKIRATDRIAQGNLKSDAAMQKQVSKPYRTCIHCSVLFTSRMRSAHYTQHSGGEFPCSKNTAHLPFGPAHLQFFWPLLDVTSTGLRRTQSPRFTFAALQLPLTRATPNTSHCMSCWHCRHTAFAA